MSCPWSNLEPATVQFCEKELCQLISQPANTWTNIGFLIVGFYILYKECSRSFLLSMIGLNSIAVGVGSTLFHMSGRFIFEVVDVFAMFLISSLMICLNLWRLWQSKTKFIVTTYVVLNILSLGLLLSFKPLGIAVFATQIYLAMTLETALYIKAEPYKYKYLLYMMGAFSLSFVIWLLDITKILCVPDNHLLTGHGIWHLLNALALYYLYRFYRQFFSRA